MDLTEVKGQYIHTQYYHLLAPPVDDTDADSCTTLEEEVVGSDKIK